MVVQENGKVCTICREFKEDSQQLFLHCSRIYRVKFRVAKMWGKNYVGLRDVPTSFNVWFHVRGNKR